MLIKVAGLDPALSNLGLAKGTFDTESGELIITDIFTQVTEPEAGKTVRKSSDDLRRANLLAGALHPWIADADAVFAEIPSGAQSARAAFGLGIALGVVGTVGIVGKFAGRPIQTNPSDVKRKAIGSKNASKEEMIEWAHGRWPNLPWKRTPSGKNKGQLSPSNEHVADACAVINAGIDTDEFKTLTQMLRRIASGKLND